MKQPTELYIARQGFPPYQSSLILTDAQFEAYRQEIKAVDDLWRSRQEPYGIDEEETGE